MRISRLLTMFLAVVMTLGVSLSLTSAPAQAAKANRGVVYAQGGEIRNSGTFYAKSRVPVYRNRLAYLQGKKKGTNRVFNVKRARTDARGRSYFRFDGPVGTCYRIYLPADSVYNATIMNIGCIVRR